MNKKRVYCKDCKNYRKRKNVLIPLNLILITFFLISLFYDLDTIITIFMFSFVMILVINIIIQKECMLEITKSKTIHKPESKNTEETILTYDILNKKNDCKYYEGKE